MAFRVPDPLVSSGGLTVEGDIEIDAFSSTARISDTARVPVKIRKNSGGSDFIQPRINFIEGANVTITVTDDSSNDEVDVEITATGGGGGGSQGWDDTLDIDPSTGAHSPIISTGQSIIFEHTGSGPAGGDIDAAGDFTINANEDIHLVAFEDISLTAATGNVQLDIGGFYRVITDGIIRFEITSNGEWEVEGDPGVDGYFLRSSGTGDSPTWAPLELKVRKNSGPSTFTRRRINFIEGGSVSIDVSDDAGNDEVDVTISTDPVSGSDDGFVSRRVFANASSALVGTTYAGVTVEAATTLTTTGDLADGSWFDVVCVGAGGGGGSGMASVTSGGNSMTGSPGGGGGAWAEKRFSRRAVVEALPIPIVAELGGAGGAAIVATGATVFGLFGSAGGNAEFGSLLVAYGGGGGSVQLSANVCHGGAGGGVQSKGGGSTTTSVVNLGGAPNPVGNGQIAGTGGGGANSGSASGNNGLNAEYGGASGASRNTSSAVTGSAGGRSLYGGGGGGAGSGYSSGAVGTGGAGGASGAVNTGVLFGGGGAGGAGNISASPGVLITATSGSDGATGTENHAGNGGGGGGGCRNTDTANGSDATAGSGGAGGFPGGGGGGGGGVSTGTTGAHNATSGAGGPGGDAMVMITVYR